MGPFSSVCLGIITIFHLVFGLSAYLQVMYKYFENCRYKLVVLELQIVHFYIETQLNDILKRREYTMYRFGWLKENQEQEIHH